MGLQPTHWYQNLPLDSYFIPKLQPIEATEDNQARHRKAKRKTYSSTPTNVCGPASLEATNKWCIPGGQVRHAFSNEDRTPNHGYGGGRGRGHGGGDRGIRQRARGNSLGNPNNTFIPTVTWKQLTPVVQTIIQNSMMSKIYEEHQILLDIQMTYSGPKSLMELKMPLCFTTAG